MLSPEQLKQRAGKLTASRVAVLMTGDAAGILRLWEEMTGQTQPEDLSGVWAVRLGETTEQLNLEWYERNGNPVTRRGEVVQHWRIDWAACTLDGWDAVLKCPIETKHCGGREPIEVIIDRYWPQMAWQMECTGADQCALSVIMGANAPVIEYVDRDDDYIDEMLTRGAQFMQHVWSKTPPIVLDPVPPPADATKIIDMAGNNEWASSAFVWIEAKPHADRCKDAEKILKSLVGADVKKAHGHGVQITRDRAGRLSLREVTQ